MNILGGRTGRGLATEMPTDRGRTVAADDSQAGMDIPEVPYPDVIGCQFHSRDPSFHIQTHLHSKFWTWGYALFRGN